MKRLKQAGVSQDRDRAAAQEVPRHHPFGASRRRHRQEGRRHREAAQEGRQDDRQRSRHLNIVEIRKPEIDAKLVAENHRPAARAPRRVPPRHEARGAVGDAAGRQGIRINCSRPLGGAEIARMEWYREGRVPLHTLRADVDYGVATAKTTYGTCGVKVWIFKGEILEHDPMAQDKRHGRGFGRIRPRAAARRERH
jgi:small subunit ribosomal protein S3